MNLITKIVLFDSIFSKNDLSKKFDMIKNRIKNKMGQHNEIKKLSVTPSVKLSYFFIWEYIAVEAQQS